MVVAEFSFAAGTMISFVMANIVVAARVFLHPMCSKKANEDEEEANEATCGNSQESNNNSEQHCRQRKKKIDKEEEFLIRTS